MSRPRKTTKSVGKTRLTIGLPTETRRRLGAYASWHGRTESAIVAEAIAELLKGFVVSQRAESPSAEIPPDVIPMREVS